MAESWRNNTKYAQRVHHYGHIAKKTPVPWMTIVVVLVALVLPWFV